MKGISLFSKYIWLILGIISLMPGMAYSQPQPFKHYQGFANKTGDYEVIDAAYDCLRQKTHVVHYYIALPSGGSKELSLPFSGYSGNGENLEPRGYFRWYNYDTDKASDQLEKYSAGGRLERMYDAHGINKGLIAYKLRSGPNRNSVGVKYTRPSDTSWTGETIACDVSRYMDGCNGTFDHEPTLSIRYIFHIMPAEKMANDIKQKLLETGKNRDYSYEDGKGVSAGLMNFKATMTLRLNQNDVSNYYFHPMNNSYTHHVFAEDEAHKIKELDFSSEVVQATKVQWRVYNSNKTQFWTYRGSSSARFFDLSLDLLNRAATSAWRNLDGEGVSSKQTFKYGDRIYVVAIAASSDGTQMCPIANFTCQLFNQYPMTADELKAKGQNTRLNSYLEDHYRSVNTVSFDDDDEEQTLLAPTSPDDNQDRLPSKWSRRSYGFVYRDLMNFAPAGSMYVNPKHSPLHGEYGLYKSANIKGKSGDEKNGTDGYLWWTKAQLYDRTYENTNGTQYGHFLYIDASDESRQIAEADFKADLCVGSQVIFSAAIADMTIASKAERPQLMFKLYGVNYDGNNQETERRLLHSFSSGNFSGNRDGTDAANVGKWYQVYGKMVLQKESGVNNFTDFKLVVDNMCKSTQGADYAFDDLRIYTKSSKVDIIQSSPICPDKNTAEDSSVSSNILTKLRALQETMAALIAPATEKKLYFRFVDAEGNPAKNVNYGTAESPNYNWGTTTIYNYVDDKQTVDGKPMYEKINDEWNVVLANRYFNLQSNQTYYVSFAFEDDSVTDKTQLAWGKPSDVCSLYSANFQMVQQKVLVTDANGSITTTVTIPCDDNGKPEYHIKAQLQTVDQNNGGSIQLHGVLYNWYVDDAKTPILENSAEFSNIPLSVGDHTIRVFPTKTSGTITQGGVDYQICLVEMSFKLRVVKNGPQLDLGVSGVVYPNNYVRTVRIGLPQVALLAQQEAKKGKGGYFCIPVSGKHFVAENSNRLYFVVAGGKDQLDPSQYTNVMYLSDTNDPAYKNRIGESLTLATLQDNYIERNTSQLKLKFTPQSGTASSASSKNVQLHEGYWYEGVLIFREDGSQGTTVLCSGEVYIRFAVVPEYATWNPTANSRMSAAWNNDENWRRSDHGELYKGADKYTDYSSGGYVPMKFTKVTIPNLSGLYFPSLGYIAYQKSTGIATRLSNAKGDAATANIQYDMLAKWDADAADHGLNADGNLECEPFYGNTCDQIYFKPGGELLNQCYLIYNKAWVEKQMKSNTWYALTSPLQDTYAGDIYVPAASGRQETEAFEPISFSPSVNNRVTSPVYQRSWDDASAQEVTLGGNYSAYDYSGTDISFDSQSLSALSAHWSHVYNKVDRKYLPLEGVAIRMGDKYTMGASGEVLLRLPKADTQYTYVSASQQQSTLSKNVDKQNAYRLVVNADAQENALGTMSYSLVNKLSEGNNYYLVGNPYMATLSMHKFLKANPSLQSSFYVYENGVLKLYDKLDMSTTTYESKNDVKISPMQSFFVRLKDGQSASQLNFTSAMTVDREVFGGVKTASDEEQNLTTLTLTAAASGYRSRSRIVLDASASEDYDDVEDAQLLYDAQLKEVPVVYTVAGDEAVALNSLPDVDWLPLGVVGKSSSVGLKIDGISRLSSPLYLYDAATRKYQELKEKEEVKVQANEHGRYFLTQTRSTTGIEDAEMGESDVKIYSPARGLIVVSKVNGPLLNKVEVYTLDGKLVAAKKAAGAVSVSIPVSSSSQTVYIIRVSLMDTQTVITKKLSLR